MLLFLDHQIIAEQVTGVLPCSTQYAHRQRVSTWTTPVLQKGVAIVGDEDHVYINCCDMAHYTRTIYLHHARVRSHTDKTYTEMHCYMHR